MSENLITINRTSTASTALAKIQDPIAAIEKMGVWFANSGMFGCSKPEQGMILAMAAITEGKSPIEIAATYHLVGGDLSMKSRAQLAKFRQAGGKVVWNKTTEKVCEATWHFEGQKVKVGFTIEEAQKMGLIRGGSHWTKDPSAMLRARATTRAITMLAPEILVSGGHVVEVDEGEGETGTTTTETPAPNPLTSATDSPETPVLEVTEAKEKPKPAPKPEPKAAPPTPKPKAEPKPAPKPKEEPPTIDVEATETPEPDTSVTKIIQVKQLISKNECSEKALSWLAGKGWIPEDGSIQNLSEENLDRILAGPEKFIRAATR